MKKKRFFRACKRLGIVKLLVIMKLTTLFLFLSVMVMAAKTYSQNIRFDLNVRNASIIEVLEEIERLTEYGFLFKADELNLEKRYSLEIEGTRIENVMDRILDKELYSYKIMDRIIVISQNGQNNFSQVKQDATSVSGQVTDMDGFPLPGVAVLVKGTSKGTVTDTDGRFRLMDISQNTVLQFSFIGMKTVEFTVIDQRQISIKMTDEAIGLDEVVAVGYGTMKKSDLTGSVKRISMDDKENQANMNLLETLSGSSAGVNIEARGGAGGQPSFSIRGQTSLSASSSPLIVVDGIIYNGSMASINISDVESIDVLKDASAAAVYGSRSANGVILITTKKGKTDKPVLAFSMYYGYQDMTNNPMKVMDGEQYAIRLADYYYQQELYGWYRTNPTSSAGKPVRPDVMNREIVAQRLRTQEERDNYMAGNSINWVDEVLQVAPIQNYNLSLSGRATDKVNYYLSASMAEEEGIQLNDKFSRFTFHNNLESEVTDWLTLNLVTSYSYLDYSGVPASLADARVASPLANNYIGKPAFDMYLTQEQYMPYPLQYLEIDNEDVRNELNLTVRAKISIPWVKGLTNELNYSHRYNNRNNNTFYPASTTGGATNKGRAVKEPTEGRDWIVNNIITYQRDFNDHRVNSTFLVSRENRKGSASSLEASQFENELLGYNNMGLGTIYDVGSSAWEESSISYMARLNYSYKSRYMITGTIRKDGFSGFGADNKWAMFPSVSLAWVMSEEPFWKERFDQSYLKLRTSYGVNGNQGIGRYASLARMGTNYYIYGAETAVAMYPTTLSNQDLRWEKTNSLNLGIDWGILDQKITGSVDVYKAVTNDVLVTRGLPRSSGFNSVWANIGGIENKGIEIELRSLNLDRDLRWETNFTFSLNRDKITKLYGDEEDMDIGNSWFVGESIGAIYDYEMAGGVWTEEELYRGEILDGWYPGQFRYVDQNDDNAIDPSNDRKIIGYKSPSYRFSISNSFVYKNFSFSFLINSIQGGDKYYLEDNASATNVDWVADDVLRKNQTAVRPYWTPDNGVNNATGIYNSPAQQSGIHQSRSFVRLQDVSLAYSFSKETLGRLGMKNCQVYISSKNPYTWTKWEGWDPESGISNFPVMRNVTAGVRFSL
ncbi:TonB-linked outer membrane protein, SusC/RagA family [Sunxiuqinia elliptica]|uniref:TonB-linked outer membrane protein, SusC/RagA family n=2 Tax=Sunxiuqinia elliptica TaxID=655355 RepID=A0A1I2JPW4_9BACT|nr:TonB-linked outer membrane protein, SusC/RagA family [Sunxiuqinia elliptica]